MYQYEICPFCNKIKALLDLHKVPYDTTEVNPLTKSEIKSWSGGYRKVPIAKIAGEQVNDSPVIANSIMDRMMDSGVLSAKQLSEFRKDCVKKIKEGAETICGIKSIRQELYQMQSYNPFIEDCEATSRI